jgi:hypothetical protein
MRGLRHEEIFAEAFSRRPRWLRLLVVKHPKSGLMAAKAYPNYLAAFPWPESDRLESHFGPKTSVLITIAKVHLWNTMSARSEPSIEDE